MWILLNLFIGLRSFNSILIAFFFNVFLLCLPNLVFVHWSLRLIQFFGRLFRFRLTFTLLGLSHSSFLKGTETLSLSHICLFLVGKLYIILLFFVKCLVIKSRIILFLLSFLNYFFLTSRRK